MSKKKTKRILLKLFTCSVYIVIMAILFICSYNLFEQKQKILPWAQVDSIDNYTYLDISKMSEKFAFNEETNIGLHFIIEEENTGLWHTYVVAINENEYEKYKAVIDYTYERTEEVPKTIRAYGYPVIASKDIKLLAIKNIPNFVPAENEVEITEENYDNYLTNCYLDTTKEKRETFSITLCISLILFFIVFLLFLLTLLDKGKKEGEEEYA